MLEARKKVTRGVIFILVLMQMAAQKNQGDFSSGKAIGKIYKNIQEKLRGKMSRQDLLGHKNGRITTHYSQVELINLIQAANKVCDSDSHKPTLTVLRRAA